MPDNVPVGHRALRVNQIDAADCDSYIYGILMEKLTTAFKYLKVQFIQDHNAELEAILKTVIWMYSMRNFSATPGQALLSMAYTSTHGVSELSPLRRVHLALHAIGSIILPWLEKRFPKLLSLLPKQLSNTLLAGQALISSLRLVNFIIFLTKGQYLFLHERWFGIRSIHPQQKTMRDLEFGYSTREIMWNGFTEFTLFLLPLVNWKTVKQAVFSKKPVQTSPTSCQICQVATPTNPHYLKDCEHSIYCYHCAAEQISIDGRVQCKDCQLEVKDFLQLLPCEHVRIS